MGCGSHFWLDYKGQKACEGLRNYPGKFRKHGRALILSATFFLYARMFHGKKIQAHYTQRSDVNPNSTSAIVRTKFDQIIFVHLETSYHKHTEIISLPFFERNHFPTIFLGYFMVHFGGVFTTRLHPVGKQVFFGRLVLVGGGRLWCKTLSYRFMHHSTSISLLYRNKLCHIHLRDVGAFNCRQMLFLIFATHGMLV